MRIAGYGHELPSVGMILASLTRYYDDDEVPAVWAKACAGANCCGRRFSMARSSC
jgi:hypothetical protein